MAGESSESSSKIGSLGSETELFQSRAHLYLIDGEESVLLQSGNFAFLLLKQSRSPLAAVVAKLGDVQWPVGKDGEVVRVGNKRYTFALPGLTYGVVLHEAALETIRWLESLLQHYSTFRLHPAITAGLEKEDAYPEAQEEFKFGCLSAIASKVLDGNSARIGRQLSAATVVKDKELTAFELERGATKTRFNAPVGRAESPESSPRVSPRLMVHIERALRLSAVAKLFSKVLVRGLISAHDHVANTLSAGKTMDLKPSGRAFGNGVTDGLAVGTVDAVAKVLEAVETAGKMMNEGESSDPVLKVRYGKRPREADDDEEQGLDQTADKGEKWWTLNRRGLRVVYEAATIFTAAAMAASKEEKAVLEHHWPDHASSQGHDDHHQQQQRGNRDANPPPPPPPPPPHQQFMDLPIISFFSSSSAADDDHGLSLEPSSLLVYSSAPSLPCTADDPHDHQLHHPLQLSQRPNSRRRRAASDLQAHLHR